VDQPAFLIDPVLLDAAGQLVGFWAAETLRAGFNVFPFRVEALQLYAAPEAPGRRATCRARIHRVEDARIAADLDVAGEDDRLWLRVTGWEDRRVDLPDAFYRMCISPRGVTLSTAWPLPPPGWPGVGSIRCCLLDGRGVPSLIAQAAIWRRVLAHLVLSRRERQAWREWNGPSPRRNEWLLGRCCAKDAVRLLARDRGGPELLPADVEILQDENSPRLVVGTLPDGWRPALAMAHAEGVAVAMATDEPGKAIGIDVQRLDASRDGFIEEVFTPQERAVFTAGTLGLAPARELAQEWALRFHCAKAAAAQAVDSRMMEGADLVVVREMDWAAGTARLALAGLLAERFPHLRNADLTVHTAREADLIVATCILDRLPGTS
jgi:phosphopantetheinyl transferase (holo-ACP synthase)